MTEDKINPIYEPREDSFLLQKEVEKLAEGDCLDVGTGSGIQAHTAAQKKEVKTVTAIDINPDAIEYASKHNNHKKIRFTVSDLFAKLSRKKFDTIIFNPPYLPGDLRIKDVALDGGTRGYELIELFLSRAGPYLKKEGTILILFSSLTNKEKIDEILEKNLWTSRLLASQKIDFEELFVYSVKKSDVLKDIEKKGVTQLDYFTKGKRGLIFTGNYKGKKISIKIQRPKSRSKDAISREVEALQFLHKNKIDFVPKVLFYGKDHFAYEYIDGITITEFAKLSNKIKIKKVVAKVMEFMYALDSLSCTKEEMHNPYKHILIRAKKGEDRPFLIDFERCKKRDNPKNITQFCQYITSSYFLSIVKDKDLIYERDFLMPLCKRYKNNKEENFKEIMNYIKNV
ncbi:MAG: HemK2/MTQ2 family protein methyltransferase [Candidatus Woesearchaeota archaeon]